MTGTANTVARLDRVVLDGESPNNLSPFIEADREQAVADLAAANHFAPLIGIDQPGPYALHLSIQEGRLIFDIRDVAGAPLIAVGLALGPFRRLVKDYQMLVDSHIKAVEEGREARIQAIDMGRRGIHDEGSRTLQERLHGKVRVDFETARRLFTLISVLHWKG